jgi:hypothetical protein
MLTKCWPLPLPAAEKLVLISLADQANDEGICWPSIESLMRRTGLSERAVRNNLRNLEADRLLRTSARKGSSNWYTLTPDAFEATPAPGAPLLQMPPTPAPGAPHPGTTCPPGGQQVPPEPSVNPQGTIRNPKRVPDGASFVPPDWVPLDAWAGWLEVRRKKRSPSTDKALSLAVRDLEKLRTGGEDPRAVLEQSTGRGWTGLFTTIRGNNHGNAHPAGRRESVAERAERINREHDDRERPH